MPVSFIFNEFRCASIFLLSYLLEEAGLPQTWACRLGKAGGDGKIVTLEKDDQPKSLTN